jgi:hypothetical protein
MAKFGAGGKASAALPWLHLPSDGFWTVHDDVVDPEEAKGARRVRKGAGNTTGEFEPLAWHAIQTDPKLAAIVAQRLLDRFFPPETHAQIRGRFRLPELRD